LSRGTSENHPQRKLNLPRRAGGLVDDPEASSSNDIKWKTKIHDIKNVEELGAELEDRGFGVSAVPEACILDQRKIQVV